MSAIVFEKVTKNFEKNMWQEEQYFFQNFLLPFQKQ